MPRELKEEFFKGGPSEGAECWKVAFGPRGLLGTLSSVSEDDDPDPCFPDLCLGFQPGTKRCRLNDD